MKKLPVGRLEEATDGERTASLTMRGRQSES